MEINRRFSIMIPSRKRPQMLKDLIYSIYHTAEEKDKVEVLVAYDNDDFITHDAIYDLKGKYPKERLLCFNRDRSYNINNDYYNWLALNYATGDYLIAVNDDTLFKTGAWDVMTSRKIEEYLADKPDRIMYGITEDREIERKRNDNNWFSCFPLLTKESVKILGFFFDRDFYKDGADWDLVVPFKAICRVLDLRTTITIEHISVRSGRRGKDVLDSDTLPLPPVHPISGPCAGKNMRRYVNYLTEYILNYNEIYKNNQNLIFNHPTKIW